MDDYLLRDGIVDCYVSDDLVDRCVKPLVCSFSELLSIDTFFKGLMLLLPHLVVFSHDDSKLYEDLRVDQDLSLIHISEPTRPY